MSSPRGAKVIIPPSSSPYRRRVAEYMHAKAKAHRIAVAFGQSQPQPSRHSNANGPRSQFANFTDLPPELRNRIYEFVAPPRSQHVVVCAAYKDPRDVPHPLSRTCRMVRREMVPYFLSGEDATVIFVLAAGEDERACRSWVDFVPRGCLGEVRTWKVKVLHSRRGDDGCRDACCRLGCEIVHVMSMDEGQAPVKWYGHMGTPKQGCGEKAAVLRRLEDLKALVWALPVEVKGPRAGGRKMTRKCLARVFDCLIGSTDEGGVFSQNEAAVRPVSWALD